jgi:hypothetical protein
MLVCVWLSIFIRTDFPAFTAPKKEMAVRGTEAELVGAFGTAASEEEDVERKRREEKANGRLISVDRRLDK